MSLPPEREGAPAPETLVRTRATIDAAPPIWPTHPAIAPQPTERNGVACLELATANAQRTILYFHGGGYRLGRASQWTGFAAALAEAAQARVILPDYRLAPEYPFPAALHDARAVLEALPDPFEPLIIAGDSAGGGLAMATMRAAQADGLALLCGAALISPWLDLTLSAETFVTNADKDRFFPRKAAAEAVSQYLQGHPADDPLVSPLFADTAALPPILILAGGDEGLLADATRYAERLAESGTSVDLRIMPGMQHVWPVIFPDLPETAEAIAAIGRFAKQVA